MCAFTRRPVTFAPHLYLISSMSSGPWKSPLQGFENADPLPTELNPDGKSLFNPGTTKSAAYDHFPPPIDSSNNGFDFHSELMILFEPRPFHSFLQFITCLPTRSMPTTRGHYTNGSGESFQRYAACFARPLNDAEYRTQLRIYRFWDKAVGG